MKARRIKNRVYDVILRSRGYRVYGIGYRIQGIGCREFGFWNLDFGLEEWEIEDPEEFDLGYFRY